MTKTETRIQLRATCPICFRDHAVRSAKAPRMVQHGYQRPEGWHQNVNECHGTNVRHFGTPEGREAAAQNAKMIRSWAESQRKNAAAYRSNPPATILVNGKYIQAERTHEQVRIDATDDRYAPAIAARIANCESQAKHADGSAAEIEKLVKEWQPKEPRAEEVATGPTLHAVNSYLLTKGRTVALCASYGFRGAGSQKLTTPERAKVNCKACLKSLDAQDADKVVAEKADALIAEMVAKYGESAKVQFSDAADKAIKEIRYHRKEIDKIVRKRATDRLERGVK